MFNLTNIKKVPAFLISVLILVVIGTGLVHAQGGQNPPQGGGQNLPQGGGNNSPQGSGVNTLSIPLPNPFNCGGVSPCTLFTFLAVIVDKIILPIGGILAVLAFIYSGFLYVTAQGDTKKISDAHRALLYTAIGTAVLLGSWVIAKLIENTINQLRI